MIVEGTMRHVLKVARSLEPVMRDAYLELGLDPRRKLLQLLSQSSYTRAWVIGKECLAIGGVIGTMLSPEANIWLSVTAAGRRSPRRLVKYTQLALSEFMSLGYRKLTTYIAADSPRDVRYAEWMGFKVGPVIDLNGFEVREAVIYRDAPPVSPFIIYALPRSRTAWMANFLSYGGWRCHHDRSLTMRSFDDVVRLFSQPMTGSAETAAAPGWHLLHAAFPEIRAVVVRRPIAEVMDSMRRLDISRIGKYDFDVLARNFAHIDRCLDRISAQSGTLTLDFHSLDREDIARKLFEFCLHAPFDRQWWLDKRGDNVQISVSDQLTYGLSHRRQIEAFKRECKGRLRTLAKRRGAWLPQRLQYRA